VLGRRSQSPADLRAENALKAARQSASLAGSSQSPEAVAEAAEARAYRETGKYAGA
jgi:hypothetical protein